MSFIVGHIFREGNTCARSLASHDTSLDTICCWDFIPAFVTKFFALDRITLPYYKFIRVWSWPTKGLASCVLWVLYAFFLLLC